MALSATYRNMAVLKSRRSRRYQAEIKRVAQLRITNVSSLVVVATLRLCYGETRKDAVSVNNRQCSTRFLLLVCTFTVSRISKKKNQQKKHLKRAWKHFFFLLRWFFFFQILAFPSLFSKMCVKTGRWKLSHRLRSLPAALFTHSHLSRQAETLSCVSEVVLWFH